MVQSRSGATISQMSDAPGKVAGISQIQLGKASDPAVVDTAPQFTQHGLGYRRLPHTPFLQIRDQSRAFRFRRPVIIVHPEPPIFKGESRQLAAASIALWLFGRAGYAI